MQTPHETNASSGDAPVAGKHHASPSMAALRREVPPLTLTFDDVAYITGSPEKKVLKGVTGIARPGELFAMLGPSGSGKTTMLTALAGRLPGKFTGTISYNGRPISGTVKRRLGFLTQDDVLYPHLTVMETLTFTAFLRLPAALSRAEKVAAAEAVAEELGITGCRDGIIGGGVVRGISGGERRRVSIGQEMLLNPSLLLLDEPTSGLDSTTAQRLMATLWGMARAGRTVVTAVHQPSSRMVQMFDRMLVLCEGAPIYGGEARCMMEYFASLGFEPGFHLVNPADFALDLANGTSGSTEHEPDKASEGASVEEMKKLLVSSYRKNLSPALKHLIADSHSLFPETNPPLKEDRDHGGNCGSSWFEQVGVLVRRGVRERKHESYSKLRLFQVLSVAFLCSLAWWRSDPSQIQDRVGLLFFFSIFWGFLPLSTGVFAFPQEWPIIVREGSSGSYRLSSYFTARTVGDLPMELLLPAVFVTVTYWAAGLDPSPAAFLNTVMVILVNVVAAQGLGLAIGAALMDVKKGSTLASVTMMGFLLVSGYYIEVMPRFVAWFKYISYSHYCFELLVGGQYSENSLYRCGPRGETCRVRDFPAVRCLSVSTKGWDLGSLAVMIVVFRAAAYLTLRRQLAR